VRCVPAFMLVAWVACAPRVVWVGSDPYRRIQAEVRSQGGAQWMRLGGQDQEHYQAIGAAGIVFSNDGTRVAYPAERAGRWWMVVDGQPQGPWDGVADPAFSRDGKHLAFLAEQAGQWRAVVDGVIGPPSPAVQRGTLRFSVNAEHWGYVALPKDGCAAIAIDGVVGPCHTAVVSMRVTNLGAAAATVRDGARFHFLFGEQMGPAVDGIGAWAISEDGRRFAYAALEGKRWHAVVDGVSGAPADGVRDFQFGDEGARLAFVATDPGRARVVVDGAEGPPFLLVGKPLLAAHGPRVAYSAQDAQGAWVVVDEDRQGPFAHCRGRARNHPVATHDLLVSSHDAPVVARRERARQQLAIVGGRTLRTLQQFPAPVVGGGSERSMFVSVHDRNVARSIWLRSGERPLRQLLGN